MADIATLLRALAGGGAQLGQGLREKQDRVRVQGIEDQENQRAQTEAALRHALLAQQVTNAQGEATAPRAPVRGTPEYEAMLEREARIGGNVENERGAIDFKRRLTEIKARGEQDRTTAAARPPADEAVNWQTLNQPDGSVVQVHPRTGQVRPLEGVRGPVPQQTRASMPTVDERRAGALYATGKQGYDTLERLLASGKGVPGWIGQQAARIGMGAGNMLTSDEFRQMRQAANVLADAWLRYTSGAAVPEQEVERFAEGFIPRAGDDPATLEQKKQARQAAIEALRGGAGRAAPPDLTLPDDPDEAARMMPGRSAGPGRSF